MILVSFTCFRKSFSDKWGCIRKRDVGKDVRKSSKAVQLDEYDEVKDLNTLRLMATKAYLFACYEVVVEEKKGKNGYIEDCDCTSPIMESETRHYCAGHRDFKPDIDCKEHVECNDPIFR